MEKVIDLSWTNPNGDQRTIKVTYDQFLTMLKSATGKEEQKQEAQQPAAATAPSVEPSQLAQQMLALQQLQLNQLQGMKLNEFQKCQLDPERMKLWAIGLPIAGLVVGSVLTAFSMSVGSED